MGGGEGGSLLTNGGVDLSVCYQSHTLTKIKFFNCRNTQIWNALKWSEREKYHHVKTCFKLFLNHFHGTTFESTFEKRFFLKYI